MSSLNRLIFKQSLVVSLLGLVTQALAFVSTVIIAKAFGASWQTDAWFFAYAIAMIVVNIVTGVAKFIFVPVFIEERVQNPEREQETVGMIVTVTLLVSLASVPFVWALARLGLMDVGSTPKMQELVVRLVIEMLPSIPLGILCTVFAMMYQSYQKFGWSELAMALRPLMVVVTLVCWPEWGIHGIAIGNNVGYGLSMVVMALILMRSTGLSLWPRWGMSAAVRNMARLAVFPLMSLVPMQIEPVALRAICARMAEGSISALNYADRLAVIPMLLIGKGFMGVILSHWSKRSAEDALDEVARSLNRALSLLFTAVCPIVAGLIVTRSHLVRFAFRRGEFTERDVELTIGVFLLLGISIIPEYLKMLLTRVMVIRRDMKRMFVLNLLYVVAEIVLAVAFGLSLGMGVYGVGLSILLTRALLLVLSLDAMRRIQVKVEWLRLSVNAIQVTLACGTMCVAAKLVQWNGHGAFVVAARWCKNNTGIPWFSEMVTFIEVSAMAVAGGAVYVGALWLMRNRDLGSLVALLRRR